MVQRPPGVEDFARINSTYLTLQDMLPLPATSRLPLRAEPPAWWWKA
jgi:hypothetical protein